MDGTAPLIGRADALAAVTAALRVARPVAVVGEAGIGKTSLVRAAAARAGRQLHEGGGFATLSWLPFLALRRAVPIRDTRSPARVAAGVRRAIGAGALFLDDLQWADESTSEVVDLLFGSVAVVVAVRAGEPNAAATIERARDRGALVVRLGGLDGRSALALARRLMAGSPEPARRRVVEAAGGNPLVIAELAAHGELPSWLTRALRRQLEGLPAGERRALEVVAAARRPLSPDALGEAGAALRDRGLLEERPGGLVIRHRLIRDALPAADPAPDADLAGPIDQLETAERRLESLDAHVAAGRLATAVARASELLSEPLPGPSRSRVLVTRGLALGLLGEAEDAEQSLAAAAEVALAECGSTAAVLSAWAEASLWSGLPKRALEQAEGALRGACSPTERVLAALTRAWAEVELGRRPATIPGDLPARDPSGAWHELRGLEALARDAADAAVASFEAAGRQWAGRHAPRELVCRWAAGEARRRAGDREAAAGLQATLAAACAIGFEPLAARVRRSLRLAGERPAPLRPARSAGDLLTARERQVLQLVERGRTNPEIARRMGLGRPTVARMLSNAMAKLGAQSRAHAVVLASMMPSPAQDWRNRTMHDGAARGTI